MTSLILSTATTYLLPLLLLLSVYLLLHGHDVPGGGFVGGVVAAAAFALYAIAHGVEEARRVLHTHPRTLIGLGLLTALLSGVIAFVSNEPFLKGLWTTVTLPVEWKLGTPTLFDVGVYLVVVGVTLMIIFSVAED
ncbi:MAG: Na+/H+ antiporter subunit B [Candidatus Abyssobacteria bacterium SURF_17]|uniref:Na+/H+ antiporter subunit B n=1 Tax=Candidatus Abyssobacteria bacterium SURF_17 TaxID=2093361 RepID=A0A419F7R6_9BACT|nr:MAG: Na+/H+ antiporter subunit B [Candidatus Abyssubacteria bacterium SURF_17]